MKTKKLLRRPLTVREILRWADLYREGKGKWPSKDSGEIAGTHGETWLRVDNCLRRGLRNLPGGSSLAQLLAEDRGVRNTTSIQALTEQQVLSWADDHHQRTGEWPTAKSGTIPDSGGEKWAAINMALRAGARDLPGGSSLARLLAEHRGVRNRKALPSLSVEGILAWADLHHERTGEWPSHNSGPITDAPGETWLAADMALRKGLRRLPGGSSLAMLLAEHRNVRNVWTLPDLTVEQILAWTDAFHERTGKWPGMESGPIPEAPGETWSAVNHALMRGSRGLPPGRSLAQLLADERGVRNRADLPDFDRKTILAWADAHFQRTGDYPTQHSGPIAEAPDETWLAVDFALRKGARGIRGGSSLARLLAKHRGKRNIQDLSPLSQKKILRWADAHKERTGKWPNVNSGEVVDAPGERWDMIDNALRQAHRHLPGGSSLLQLLVKKRGVRNPLDLPPLTEEQIVGWAESHRDRTGRLPKYKDGPIADAVGETWAGVDGALRLGKRGLPGGSSLAKLLAGETKTPEVEASGAAVR
jgi:hypothetical protein